MTRRLAAAIIFLLIIISIVVWQKTKPSSLCQKLDCFLMKEKENYVLEALYSDTKEVYRALYKHNGRYIRLEARSVDPSQKDAELHAATNRMRALFEKAPAPYPGEISDAIVCDPAFVPVEKELKNSGITLTYFIGYLNNRMTFGSCSLDQAVYKGIVAYTYCPAKNLYLSLELFAPTQEFETDSVALEDHIRSVRCVE